MGLLIASRHAVTLLPLFPRPMQSTSEVRAMSVWGLQSPLHHSAGVTYYHLEMMSDPRWPPTSAWHALGSPPCSCSRSSLSCYGQGQRALHCGSFGLLFSKVVDQRMGARKPPCIDEGEGDFNPCYVTPRFRTLDPTLQKMKKRNR